MHTMTSLMNKYTNLYFRIMSDTITIWHEMEEEERYNELMKIYEEQEKRRLEDSEYAYNMGVIDHIVTTEELYEMFMEDDYVDDNDEIDCNNSEYGDSYIYNQSDYVDDDTYEY